MGLRHLRNAPRSLSLGGLLPVLLAGALVGCAVGGPPRDQEPHEMLDAVVWQRLGAEYEAVARQTYRLAAHRLAQALADPSWSAALEESADATGLPPAVVLDIDETVLDNTPYEVRIIREHGAYSPATFAAWCEESAAVAVPGAREFLREAVARGVEVFFYTARRESLRTCTRRNLEALELPVAADGTNLLMADGGAKDEWRRRIARHHRILLLVGDNLEDFVAGSRQDPAARRALVRRHGARWGRQWIILPNPMYGHWESALYDFDHGLSRAARTARKARGLEASVGD
ncbi:MAG: HAD family acid phosphatase [Gammaproteobacteria bacterium]|nr:HAD family acid phosphatase [Gammaproteobacteria bacterium]